QWSVREEDALQPVDHESTKLTKEFRGMTRFEFFVTSWLAGVQELSRLGSKVWREGWRLESRSSVGLDVVETSVLNPVASRRFDLAGRSRDEVPPHHDGLREGSAAD